MLINDLTLTNVIKSQTYKPFFLTYDVDVKTPAVTIIDANDYIFLKKAENQGFPIITHKDGFLLFPNGWKIPLKKPELIKTKIFHLMKKFYRLSDEIQIADNTKIHLVNDWCERNASGKKGNAFVIFLLLTSFIYGGALRTNWFFRYARSFLFRALDNHISRFFLKHKVSGDLVYLRSETPKDKMVDFYFYEQDFRGVYKISDRE